MSKLAKIIIGAVLSVAVLVLVVVSIVKTSRNAKNNYTVSFYNGETLIVETKVKYGSKVSRPEDPTEEDKIFDNWYVDSNFTNIFNFDTLIKQDTKVYAKFNIKQYTVKFETNGGSELADMKANAKSTITLPLSVKENFSLVGWYKDSNLTEEFKEDTKVNADIIICKMERTSQDTSTKTKL